MKRKFLATTSLIFTILSSSVYADNVPKIIFEDTAQSQKQPIVIEQADPSTDVKNPESEKNIAPKENAESTKNTTPKENTVPTENIESKKDNDGLTIDDAILNDITTTEQTTTDEPKVKLETVNNYRIFTFKIYDANSKKTYNFQANKAFTYDYKQKVPPLIVDEWSFNVFVKKMEEFFSNKNGKMIFTPEKIENSDKYKIISKKSGQIKIDKEALKKDLMNRIRIADYSQVTLPLTEESKLSLSLPKNEIIELAQYTTYYNAGDYGRTQNILLAGNAINGTKLNPNEVFSYNKKIRPITPYLKNAKIIVGDEYVDGIGGGLCQPSTTLFNTVIESGLKVNHRRNHTKKSHYVAVGRDAMVSSSNDFIFTNNFKNPIYIMYYKSGPNGITFKIFGNKSDKKTVKTWVNGGGSLFTLYRQIGKSVDRFSSSYTD